MSRIVASYAGWGIQVQIFHLYLTGGVIAWDVDWRADSLAAAVQYVRINRGCRNVSMTQLFLNCPDVIAVLEQVRSIRVEKDMATGGLRNPSLEPRLPKGPLQDGSVQVMPAPLAGGHFQLSWKILRSRESSQRITLQ